jgi:hypothetical protein
MTESSRRVLFMLVFALVFYVTGASFVQSFVNYPTWKLIGASEFTSYHQGMSSLIIKTMVLPWLVEILLTIVLLWLRPRVIPRRAIALALILNLIPLISTITIQIPIQIQLGENGQSLELLNRLVATDPIRWTPGILRALLYLWMMSLVVRSEGLSSERGVRAPIPRLEERNAEAG